MADDETLNMVDRWSSMAEGLSPRRVEMKRLADAGREVIERMATTDAPHEVIERAAELLEAAAAELDGPGKVRRYEGFAESANAGGDPHAHFDHSPIMGMANPIAPPIAHRAGRRRPRRDARPVRLGLRGPARVGCTAASSPRRSTRCSG